MFLLHSGLGTSFLHCTFIEWPLLERKGKINWKRGYELQRTECLCCLQKIEVLTSNQNLQYVSAEKL